MAKWVQTAIWKTHIWRDNLREEGKQGYLLHQDQGGQGGQGDQEGRGALGSQGFQVLHLGHAVQGDPWEKEKSTHVKWYFFESHLCPGCCCRGSWAGGGPGELSGVQQQLSTHLFTFVATIASGSLLTCRSLKVGKEVRGQQVQPYRAAITSGVMVGEELFPLLPEVQGVL